MNIQITCSEKDFSEIINSIISFLNLKTKIDSIMETQSQFASQLNDLTAQLTKVNTEIQGKLAELQTVIEDAGNVTPELQTAFDNLKASADVLDGIVPDQAPSQEETPQQ